MSQWLVTLILAALERVLAFFWKKYQEKEAIEAATEADLKKLDAAFDAYKSAYSKFFDGQPVTKEQDEALRAAISDLIRA